MYIRVRTITASNEIQLNMWLENFKNVLGPFILQSGALKVSVSKIDKNKAIVIVYLPDKELANKLQKSFNSSILQMKEFLKIDEVEGEVIFNIDKE